MLRRRDILTGSSAALIAGAMPRFAWGKTEADVVIIGAGLAGLMAAQRLEAAGLKIVIVEGENRVGGRLHTLDDLPGKPEAGGIQVGRGYAHLRSTAQKLGIELLEGPSGGAGAAESRTALFHINGQTIAANNWPNSPANHLAAAEKGILPLALGFHYGSRLPQLGRVSDWMSADPAQDISFAQALKAAGASPEALRLIQANFNGNALTDMSQLSNKRATAIFRAGPGPISTIKGGSQRLPEAMAAALASPVRQRQIVSAIAEDAAGVTVSLADGQNIRARHAICTLPFAALRSVRISGSIAPPIRKLIATLPDTQASFVYLSASEAFWKMDGQPETLWTDDPLLGRVFVLGDSPPMLKVWTTGASALALGRLTPEQAGSAIISRIEAARPSAKGKLKLERILSWRKNPMARGIYHHIGTGQAQTLAQAVQTKGRRLHFAGEHMAQLSSGMEAALESGDRIGKLVAALV